MCDECYDITEYTTEDIQHDLANNTDFINRHPEMDCKDLIKLNEDFSYEIERRKAQFPVNIRREYSLYYANGHRVLYDLK
jgi:hypothetical protein